MRVLHFARHGESEANLTHEFANRSCLGLTALGRRQAERLARELTTAGIVEVHTSPLARARQTAEVVSAALGVPCRVVPALREYDVGELEGQANPRSWRRYAELERAWLVERRFELRHPGGESFHDVAGRFGPYLDEVLAAEAGPLLAVSHGGLLRLMLAHFAGVGYERAYAERIPNCGVVTVTGDRAGARCAAWCADAPQPPG